NITAPSPSEACAWRAPMKRISSSGGNSPVRPSAPLQACAAGSSVKRCGVPVAIARTLARRNWEAASLDACRSCTPASPPVTAAAAITPRAAMSATATSISTSETPRWRRCLLVADVGIRAAATRLAVTAQHHQLEGGVLARRLVQHRVAPGIVEFLRTRIRAQPAADAGRLGHQLVQGLRQPAGIHLECL